jgi:hypothetical protein
MTIPCLKDFTDLFLNNGEYDYYRYIWPTEAEAFVRLENYHRQARRPYYRWFWLQLFDPKGSEFILSICAKEREEAVTCLEFLLGLADSYFPKICVCRDASRRSPKFPLPNSALEDLLRKEIREITFDHFTFYDEQLRIVWASEQQVKLTFHYCTFLDDGTETISSSQEEQERLRGPRELTLYFLRIDDCFGSVDRGIAFLNRIQNSRLESLDICYSGIEDRRVCQALATFSLPKLCITNSSMIDSGRSIIDNLGRGASSLFLSSEYMTRGRARGKRGLNPFETLTQWRSFLNTLRGNNHLECLTLSHHDLGVAEWLTLADALRENQGLVCLTISNVVINDDCWNQLLQSVSSHKRLRELNFSNISPTADRRHFSAAKKKCRTKTVHELLSVSTMLDTVCFDPDMYDLGHWERHVRPRLKHNLYRKRFERIQKTESQTLRRAPVIGAGLAAVRTDPALIWLLLSMNQDIVAERSLLPRKRESVSLDTPLLGQKRSRLHLSDAGTY